jgi:hypothetical protein
MDKKVVGVLRVLVRRFSTYQRNQKYRNLLNSKIYQCKLHRGPKAETAA